MATPRSAVAFETNPAPSLAGARITLTEESKGLARESESDNGGAFLFPSVIAGIYSVRVEKQGFSAGLMSELRIEVGKQASLAITLRVGEMRTAITLRHPQRLTSMLNRMQSVRS